MYKDYLQSPHWKEIRQQKIMSRPFCQVCGSDKLQIHHKHYTKKSGESILFRERIQDLLSVCPSCHRLIHKYFGNCKKLNKKTLRVKRLMELGVVKNKAFFIVSNPDLYESIYLGLVK